MKTICPAVTLALAMFLAIDGGAAAERNRPEATWPDSYTTRIEILALLRSLDADLLGHDSATSTLERWCDVHRMASPATIVATLVGEVKAPSAEDRKVLAVSDAEPVRYRRVLLKCGDHILSEADNWYVPSRLTPEMNVTLDTTTIPFGRAVQALQFRRRTLSAKMLWSPLPDGWEMGVPAPPNRTTALQVPAAVIEHRAVLTRSDGMPFSEVVETYTGKVLDFSHATPDVH